MTDLQDLLLDKLATSPVGAGWEDGPFRLAADLIPGKPIRFKGRYEDATAKNAIAARLGYPAMLLHAAQGAVSALADEEDRRALAMTVLRAVTPGIKQKPRPREVYVTAAVEIARRCHALHCRAKKCPLTAALDAFLSADTWRKQDQAVGRLFKSTCPTHGRPGGEKVWITTATPPLARTVQAATLAVASNDTEGTDFYTDLNRVGRETGRAAAAVGVRAAVALCADLARRLGMEAEAVGG
jgi:hypothetical protein